MTSYTQTFPRPSKYEPIPVLEVLDRELVSVPNSFDFDQIIPPYTTHKRDIQERTGRSRPSCSIPSPSPSAMYSGYTQNWTDESDLALFGLPPYGSPSNRYSSYSNLALAETDSFFTIDGNEAASPSPPSRGSTQDPAEAPQDPPRKKPKAKISKPSTEILKSWLFEHEDHPYPNEKDKQSLAAATGLTPLQVNYWMINARRRILKGNRPSNAGKGPRTNAKGKEQELSQMTMQIPDGNRRYGVSREGSYAPNPVGYGPSPQGRSHTAHPPPTNNFAIPTPVCGGNLHNYHGSLDGGLLSRNGIDSNGFLNQFIGYNQRY